MLLQIQPAALPADLPHWIRALLPIVDGITHELDTLATRLWSFPGDVAAAGDSDA